MRGKTKVEVVREPLGYLIVPAGERTDRSPLPVLVLSRSISVPDASASKPSDSWRLSAPGSHRVHPRLHLQVRAAALGPDHGSCRQCAPSRTEVRVCVQHMCMLPLSCSDSLPRVHVHMYNMTSKDDHRSTRCRATQSRITTPRQTPRSCLTCWSTSTIPRNPRLLTCRGQR